jgi:calcineurin-like phosphoesterase family protein
MFYFSSDFHLFHKNIIKHCNRPFSSIEEMNETIIDNYNAVVKPNDIFYFLGDFCWNLKLEQMQGLLNRFNGKKNIIMGNHDDKKIFRNLSGIESLTQNVMLKAYGEHIWLSHYSHRVWDRSHHGAWHLFGHSHGSIPPHNKSFDVGVDCWEFKPLSFEQIKIRMDNLP